MCVTQLPTFEVMCFYSYLVLSLGTSLCALTLFDVVRFDSLSYQQTLFRRAQFVVGFSACDDGLCGVKAELFRVVERLA